MQWSTAPEPGLSPSEQAALAGLWLEAARYEHASIAAFARLGRDLRAVGAPACLVDGARRAALDEVDHAQRCFAIASRLAHRDLRAGTLRGARAGARRAPRGRRRKLELERVAVESLLDGCLNEAYAAAIAAGQAAVCTDARIAADLASMAREEAGHAALAWDTLEWCLATGGEEVRVAVLDALRTAAAPRMTAGESVAADALARYGRARTAAIDEALRDVHRQVWVRLDEIVDAGAERGNLASDIEILSRPA